MPNWDKYYEFYRTNYRSSTIADQVPAYKKALDQLQITDPKTVVLGGFASRRSLEHFENLVRELFPNARTFALDINSQPLVAVTSPQVYERPPSHSSPLLQANLCSLPFVRGSVDLLILDYTFNCMTQQQVKGFLNSETTSNSLAPNGTVLATLVNTERASPIRKFQLWWMRNILKHPYNFYSTDKLLENTGLFELAYRDQSAHMHVNDLSVDIIALKTARK